MNKEKVFVILNIKETKDINKIKKAYRKQLVHVNPEDDPEGFKELREAYEEALRISETEGAEETEELEEAKGREVSDPKVAIWIDKVKEIYNKLSLRRDTSLWEEILSNEVCKDFDTKIEARNLLLTFIMDHYRLPKKVWKIIIKTFDLVYSKEELYEHFPISFIDFVTEDPENKEWLNFSLLEGEETADIDTFIRLYEGMRNILDAHNYDITEESIKDVQSLIEGLECIKLYHPYVDVEKMRYYLVINNTEQAKSIAEKLREKQYDDLYIRYYLALTSLKTGDLERAYKEAGKILEEDKKHYGATYIIMSYFLETGQYKEAKKGFTYLLEAAPTNELASEGLRKANEKLIESYEEELTRNPDNKELKIELSKCFLQNDRYQECINLIKEMAIDEKKEQGIYYDYHHVMASAYFGMEDYKDAYPHIKIWIEEVLKAREENMPEQDGKLTSLFSAYMAMAECLFGLAMDETDANENKGDIERIIQYTDLAIKEAKDLDHLIMALSAKSHYLLRMGSAKHCIDVCDEILRLDKEYFPAYLCRQEAYYKLGMAQEVIDDYYRAIEIFPGAPQPYIFAVKVFLVYREYEAAKKVLERADEEKVESNELKLQKLRLKVRTLQDIEIQREVIREMEALYHQVSDKPGDIQEPSYLLYEMAVSYFEIGDYDKALAAIEERLKFSTDNRSLILKADILKKSGRYEEAIENYIKIPETDRYYIGSCCQIGYCYKMLKRNDRAIDYYLKATQADKNHEYAYGELMDIYYERYSQSLDKEDYNLAVRYGVRQAEIDPCAYYYNRLGLVYRTGYEFEKAIEAFKEALKYDETYMYAYNNMGYAYEKLGNLEEAYKCYQLALKYRYEGNIRPYTYLANYYKVTSQYEKAIETYEIINKETNNPLETANELAEVYSHMQEWDKAILWYTNLYEANEIEEMEYLLKIGMIYCFTDPDKALDYFKKAKERYSKHPKPYSYIGDYMLWMKEDAKEAVRYYEIAYQYYHSDYDEFIKYVLLYLLYALRKLGKQQEINKYIKEIEEFIVKKYGSIENWLKDPTIRKQRLCYLAQWSYFSLDYDKARDYMQKMKDAPMCACNFSECLEHYILEGIMFELEENYIQASENYEKVVKLYPDDIFHQYILKQMRKKVGNKL